MSRTKNVSYALRQQLPKPKQPSYGLIKATHCLEHKEKGYDQSTAQNRHMRIM